jgi:hypothetical protein
LVQKFITTPTLAGKFSLPRLPEAFQEIKDLQQDVVSIVLSSANIDSWTYVWGTASYTSRKYY